MDPDGRVLNGFYSEPNKSWFLFVTSDTDVTNPVLTYTGNITAASAGVLDTDAKTVTMPFTRNGGKVRLTDDAGNEYQITVLQSTLPSMYIDLAEGLTLEILNGGSKDDKYPGNAVSITTTLTGKTLTMTLQHVSAYSNVSFAVWSEKDGQDDLVWYPGTADGKGTVTCTVDLTQHWNEGNCLIHIYGDVNKVSTYITGTIIKMADKPEEKPEEPKNVETLIKEADGQFHYYLNGKPVADKYGYVEYDGGLFLVAHGVVATDKNGLAQDPITRKWYFFASGQAQLQYTGLAKYNTRWFYVDKGVFDDTFSGVVLWHGTLFKVEKGVMVGPAEAGK